MPLERESRDECERIAWTRPRIDTSATATTTPGMVGAIRKVTGPDSTLWGT